MAESSRSIVVDLFQAFRFQVVVLGEPGRESIANSINSVPEYPDAGFSECVIPELTLGVAEYREGIDIFTRKQPGIPTFNEITLTRGLTRRDSGFFKWILKCIKGEEYRVNVEIDEYHKSDIIQPKEKRSPSRRIIIVNAFPMRYKPSTDLSATSEDIVMNELDLAYERFYIITPDGTIGNDIL